MTGAASHVSFFVTEMFFLSEAYICSLLTVPFKYTTNLFFVSCSFILLCRVITPCLNIPGDKLCNLHKKLYTEDFAVVSLTPQASGGLVMPSSLT